MIRNKQFRFVFVVMMVVVLALVTMPVTPAYALACTWTGTTNTAWATASNWSGCGGVAPGAADDVTIPNVANDPVISVLTGNVTVASITINNGGVLTVNSAIDRTITVSGNVVIDAGGTFAVANATGTNAHTLNVGGNFTNSGTFTAVNSNDTIDVIFNGTTQAIGGTAATTFNALTINSGSTTTVNTAPVINATITINGTIVLPDGITVTNDGSAIVTLGANGVIKTADADGVTGSAATSFGSNFTTASLNTNGTVEYNQSGNQTITGRTYQNLTTSGSGIKTLGGGYTVNGTFTIGSGTTVDEAAFTGTLPGGATLVVNGTLDFTSSTGLVQSGASGTTTLTMGANGLIRTADDSGLGPATNASLQTQAGGAWTTTSISTNGTVEYNRNATSGQVVTDRDYNNLTITGATQTKTWTLGGTRTVNGNLTINSGAPLTLSGAQTVNVKGNWSNSGLFTAGTSTVAFNGSAAQTIGGTSATTFNNLTLNNANGLTLNTNATVNNILTFTNGKITTDANVLILPTTATVSGASSSNYVYGNVQRAFTSGSLTFSFPIGDASLYDPLSLTFASISTGGNVTASVTGADCSTIVSSDIDSDKSVNHCWTLTNGGTGFTSYDATFNYGNGSDVDGGTTPANFIVERYNGSTWSSPLTLSGTPSGTNATITGVTSMSDFAVGESKVTPTLSVTNSPVTYNGSPQAATVVGSVAGTVSDIKYDGSTTVPTNVGTYAITADFAPDDPVHYKHLNDASAGNFVIAVKAITITPDDGQSKVYGAADPVFTYTFSPTLESGDSFSGALGRAAGENVGSYAYTLGTLSAGANYALSLDPGHTFAITPANTTTSLTSSLNPSVFGSSVTFTATVVPSTATGTVQFFADGNPLGSAVALLGGEASVSTASLAVGTHVITATYSGDSNYSASTSTPLAQTVEATLSVNTVGSGTAAKDPDQATYHYGDVITLTATPATGWSFGAWSGDLVSTANPVTITIDGSKVVTATFTQNEYTLSVNMVGSGTVAKDPDQATYHYGDVITLTATPDTGWAFSFWSGDVTVSTNPVTITIDGNKSVTGTFTLNEYALTIHTVGSGSVTKNPDQGTYAFGTVVTLTAVPSAGWSFNAWSGDVNGTTNPETITIDGSKVVTATFTQNEYTLTTNTVGNGSVSQTPDQSTYHYGDVITLTATPSTGWAFSVWSGDAAGSTNPVTITVTANHVVTATFTQNQHTLTVNTVGSGSVTKNPDQGTYAFGTVVTLTAVPSAGWSFGAWSGAVTGSTNPVTITIDSNKVVTATFTQNQHTLTVNTVGSGSVTKNPNQATYTFGTVVTLTAVPASNWAFSAWSGAVTSSANPVTITISGNSVVTATFINTCQPVTGVDFSFSPTAPRVGQSVNFTATTTGGTTPITYTWNFGHGSNVVTTAAAIAHGFPLTTTAQTYSVALTTANACTSPTAPVAKSVTVWPYLLYLPIIMR